MYFLMGPMSLLPDIVMVAKSLPRFITNTVPILHVQKMDVLIVIVGVGLRKYAFLRHHCRAMVLLELLAFSRVKILHEGIRIDLDLIVNH